MDSRHITAVLLDTDVAVFRWELSQLLIFNPDIIARRYLGQLLFIYDIPTHNSLLVEEIHKEVING